MKEQLNIGTTRNGLSEALGVCQLLAEQKERQSQPETGVEIFIR